MTQNALETTLDLRPIFARGDTPCATIDEAAATLPPGQALVLLVPFEPVPLYNKLGKAGFSHQTTRLEDGAWRVKFTPGNSGIPAGQNLSPCGCSHR